MQAIVMNGWRRVSKRRARLAYARGETVHLVPVRMIPGGMFGMDVRANDAPFVRAAESWAQRVRWFAFYNCGGHECGRYLAYYVREG